MRKRVKTKPVAKIRTNVRIEASWSKPVEQIVLVPYKVGSVTTFKAMPDTTRRKK